VVEDKVIEEEVLRSTRKLIVVPAGTCCLAWWWSTSICVVEGNMCFGDGICPIVHFDPPQNTRHCLSPLPERQCQHLCLRRQCAVACGRT
jgi:hypothetical protein